MSRSPNYSTTRSLFFTILSHDLLFPHGRRFGSALGASIDFRRPSAGAPLEPPFREGSYTSIELNTTTRFQNGVGRRSRS
jgi:hypothetical protein